METITIKKLLTALAIILLAACNSETLPDSGPVLLAENTLAPTILAPTRIITSTPEPSRALPTGEVLSPLENVTVNADFVLVTPTLPPSKTPTGTPTLTQTPTLSPTPTVTVTATATRALFPTSVIIPITAAVANPLPQLCDSLWFFLDPQPSGCPRSAPASGPGVFQRFQNGYMIWAGTQDAIYVMYNDLANPQWQVFRDIFDDGMQEDDPEFNNPPAPDTWQPRRGFGMLWRGNEDIRNRIGWAIDELEEPFDIKTQIAGDGTLFFSDPTGSVFGLIPNGVGWTRYSGFGE